MAKGLAVISGSNTVVFKALESGVVKMGGVHPDGSSLFAGVTISGSLALSGSEGIKLNVSGSEFKLENLSGDADKIVISGLDAATSADSDGNAAQPSVGDDAEIARDRAYQLKGGLLWAATSSAPIGALEDKVTDEDAYYAALEAESGSMAAEDFLMISEDGELRRVNKIDASVVMLNDGQTVEQQVGGLNLNLRRTSGHGEAEDNRDVNLTKGRLELIDVDTRTKITTADSEDGESVQVTIDLDENLEVETLSASMGLEVTGSSNLKGKLHVVDNSVEIDDALDVHGAATVDGNMTIKGDLTVWGDTTVTTADSKHLKVEDSIIQIGFDQVTGSESASDVDPADFDLGFVFGTANQKALVLKDGILHFGDTLNSAGDSEITVTASAANQGKLVLSDLSASQGIDALDLRVHDSATITGKLTANANVDLGNASTDIVNIIGTLTASAEALFKEHVTISGDDKTDLTISNGDLTVVGSGSFTGDLNVDGTGSFGQSVTLRAGANLDITDGNLDVNGVTTLSASLGGDQPALDVTGTTTLSSSAGSNALHVDSGDVLFDDALTVGGVVTLNDAAGALNVAGEWTEEAALKVAGSLNVSGSVRLGEDLDDRVVVQGQFRIPKFTRTEILADTDANGVPKFVSEASQMEGYMFYLDSDHDDNDPYFPRGKKWYFNEGGVWHSSFFWDDGAEALADDGNDAT